MIACIIRGTIWGKTREQLRRDVVFGKNPLTGNPVMQEIVDKLTKPLTAEEKRTGELKRDTVEKFAAWVTVVPIGAKPVGMVGAPNDGSRRADGTFTVIVTGGSNNNYFSMGGLTPGQSIQIDKWR